MKIVFLRHGQSMGNVWSDSYKNDAINFLSLRGVKQAELASYSIQELLPRIDQVITSDLTRARQTAITVMQSMDDWKRPYHTDARINEWCWNAPGIPDWYLVEPEPEFWSRVDSFYTQYIAANMEQDVNLFITSHYYSMFAIFEIIKRGLGVENLAYMPLHRSETNGIPHSIPWFFDSFDNQAPQMILPGHNDINR